MPSSPDRATPAITVSSELSSSCKRWNRRLHYFLGLYFLFFIWLFAFTGLILNHPSWEFFRLERKSSTTEHSLQHSVAGGTLDQARDVMRQLGIVGEIDWVTTQSDPARLDFRVTTPALLFDIKADFRQARATIQRSENNAWGTVRLLHTFTGVRQSDPQNSRDWILTSMWAFSMDAVAVAIAVMVLGGIYMWYELTAKRSLGLIVLVCGLLICGWFVIGLKWIYA
jgi:hypothetical protein